MDKELLYADDACRLCGFEDRDHAENCPGHVIERIRYEVRYSGPNCGRGCCGYTDGTGDGQSLDAAIQDAAESIDKSDAVSWRCDARIVFDLDSATKEVTRRVEKIRSDREAKETADREANRIKERNAAHAAAISALDAERGDLTPEAYERRRAAIEAEAANAT